MKKIKLSTALTILSALNLANAATTTAPMQVSATVNAQCNVNAQNMAFGSVDLGAGSGLNTTYSVECTNGTAYSVSWDGGLNLQSTQRRLKHATLNEYLAYDLLLYNIGLIPINQSADNGTGNGIGSSIQKTLTGMIRSGQTASAGNYTDTITLTITY